MSAPLSGVFSKALSAASKAYDLPTADDATQDLIRTSLADLQNVNARVLDLSLFSPNETLEDITTPDLVYLFVPYVIAEVLGRVKALERDDRMRLLQQAESKLKTFIFTLEHYNIVPEDERKLHERGTASIPDPARRRETKIKQFQKEKELKGRVEALRKRRNQRAAEENDTPNDFDLIGSLLPAATTTSDQEEDAETDEILRETTLILLRLCYAKAQAELGSINQELDLLKSAPQEPSRTPADALDPRSRQRQEQDAMWRIDVPQGSDANGPLLDPDGKPLRPFTILPAGAADRARLQNQVFGPGHNLPTMTVDEYLQIEKERGKFISGGGKASESALTESEQLALDAEMDGTAESERRAEEKRLKDENWAQYTDTHARGAGNTMNRG
ncbi:TAP42-like protein [Schizophyllum commune H4-8]|uniref:TAP42-like protein n=1 Tax=Schizophyllum commune (strain H4-8 / FGSC 9210) TaxID=578458 RepID=UPI00215F8C8F|nr:TAP42-like protein [Schizophyllum commune H4-8]KAI5900437.1 TAP42-like protein [Schizophyllum commune H4-8]